MDKEHELTDKKLEKIERKLKTIYSRAQKDLGKAWKVFLAETGDELKALQEAYELAKNSGDAKKIKSAGIKLSRAKKQKTLLNDHFKNLSKQLAAEVSNVNKTAMAYLNNEIPEIYVLNYNGIDKKLRGIPGYSFELVDRNVVENLAKKDNNLLPYKFIDGVKDVRWNEKKITAEVLQGILLGEPMEEIANRFENVLGMNQDSAINNARTAVTSAECKGRQDSYEKAEADGIIMEKGWTSTNDSRTRHWHDELNGTFIPVDKSFHNVIRLSKHKSLPDTIKYPGDPEAHPANVYGCRCTLTAKVIGYKKILSEKQKRGSKIEVRA